MKIISFFQTSNGFTQRLQKQTPCRMALAVLIIEIASSCQVDHRSQEFACVNQTDCTDGRVCTDGFCVRGEKNGGQDDAGIDASTDCDPACTFCDDSTCYIECGGGKDCTTRRVTCPVDKKCVVTCTGDNACGEGIECESPFGCEIHCTGTNSCNRKITCQGGPCNIECIGTNACSRIDCSAACSCDTDCNGCGGFIGPTCPGGGQCKDPDTRDCTSLNDGCDLCP